MTQEQLSKLNIYLVVALLISGAIVWVTTSGIAIAVFCVALALLGANVTGLLYWLFGKDE